VAIKPRKMKEVAKRSREERREGSGRQAYGAEPGEVKGAKELASSASVCAWLELGSVSDLSAGVE
jgi:hypothetical protein